MFLNYAKGRSSVPFNFVISTNQIIFKRPFSPTHFLKCYYFKSAGLVTQRSAFIKCRYLHLAHALSVEALHASVAIAALVLGNLSDVGAEQDRLQRQATSRLQREGIKSLYKVTRVLNATAAKQRYHFCLPFHTFLQSLKVRITVPLRTVRFHRVTLYTRKEL
jgi:hypothetical protein